MRWRSAALIVFALAASPPAFGQAIITAVQPLPSIYNFGQVSDTYYRGAEPDAGNFAEMAKLGIKTVIDLQKDGNDEEAASVERAGMRYLQIPMSTHVPPTPGQIAQFLAVVNDPAKQPVYVHCREGRHRTGVMTAVYRMTNGWTADQAFKEMKSYRFGFDFLHSEFKRFVYGYQPAPAVALRSN
jgi:tyrosine-protein phosphatase SIW14